MDTEHEMKMRRREVDRIIAKNSTAGDLDGLLNAHPSAVPEIKGLNPNSLQA